MTVLRSLLREPLLHFLVLGAGIFGLFALFDDSPPPRLAQRLEVTEADVERLAGRFEATWQRPPAPRELASIVERHVEEELLVREALALGLDRDDEVVRRRLAQKMEFLLESGVGQPTDEELRSHLEAFPERFERPALVTFEQVSLGERPADVILAALASGAAPETLGARSLLPVSVAPSPERVVDGVFGTGFFDRIARLPEGDWTGPVESAYGSHLVRLRRAEPARVPPLNEVREAVERDWLAQARNRLAAERIEALRARYEIDLPAVDGAER